MESLPESRIQPVSILSTPSHAVSDRGVQGLLLEGDDIPQSFSSFLHGGLVTGLRRLATKDTLPLAPGTCLWKSRTELVCWWEFDCQPLWSLCLHHSLCPSQRPYNRGFLLSSPERCMFPFSGPFGNTWQTAWHFTPQRSVCTSGSFPWITTLSLSHWEINNSLISPHIVHSKFPIVPNHSYGLLFQLKLKLEINNRKYQEINKYLKIQITHRSKRQ